MSVLSLCLFSKSLTRSLIVVFTSKENKTTNKRASGFGVLLVYKELSPWYSSAGDVITISIASSQNG